MASSHKQLVPLIPQGYLTEQAAE